jgi:hypothetical protein
MMQNYRLYFLDRPQGHIERFEPIVALGDYSAMKAARRFRGPLHLELYWRARKVGEVEATDTGATP